MMKIEKKWEFRFYNQNGNITKRIVKKKNIGMCPKIRILKGKDIRIIRQIKMNLLQLKSQKEKYPKINYSFKLNTFYIISHLVIDAYLSLQTEMFFFFHYSVEKSIYSSHE